MLTISISFLSKDKLSNVLVISSEYSKALTFKGAEKMTVKRDMKVRRVVEKRMLTFQFECPSGECPLICSLTGRTRV